MVRSNKRGSPSEACMTCGNGADCHGKRIVDTFGHKFCCLDCQWSAILRYEARHAASEQAAAVAGAHAAAAAAAAAIADASERDADAIAERRANELRLEIELELLRRGAERTEFMGMWSMDMNEPPPLEEDEEPLPERVAVRPGTKNTPSKPGVRFDAP